MTKSEIREKLKSLGWDNHSFTPSDDLFKRTEKAFFKVSFGKRMVTFWGMRHGSPNWTWLTSSNIADVKTHEDGRMQIGTEFF